MKRMLVAFALIAATAIPCISQAQSQKVKEAVATVKELCLSGNEYDLKADAKGNLTLTKLMPGGEGEISVNARQSAGAAAIFDDKLRIIADKEVRDCIKPYIKQIMDSILNEKPAEKPVSENVQPNFPTGTVLVGCGCWGFMIAGQTAPAPVCATHQQVALPCIGVGVCPTGGAPWGTQCS